MPSHAVAVAAARALHRAAPPSASTARRVAAPSGGATPRRSRTLPPVAPPRASSSSSSSSTAAAVDAETVHAIRSGPPDDGTAIVPLRAWLEARDGDPAVASVYAVYGADDVMRYVGYAKDASRAVRSHLERQGDDAASKVRVAAFANKATATRANLRAEQDRWIGEWVVSRGGAETEIPVGNQAAGAARWTLTPAESWENEEKPAPAEAKANEAGTPSVGADGEVISPYAAEAAGADAEEEEALDPNRELLPLTVENVDKALDEVRPYLIADGGNVAVVGIEDGVVAVRMSGACGSCSSSTATLKGGIEKTLRRVFGGENVKEVVNLDSDEPGSALTLSKEAVEAHLEKLAGAIHNYGGSVKLLEVIESERALVLEFSGPVALAQSIASSIKGKFPLVAECKIKQV